VDCIRRLSLMQSSHQCRSGYEQELLRVRTRTFTSISLKGMGYAKVVRSAYVNKPLRSNLVRIMSMSLEIVAMQRLYA
jgi:hypothetical protein